MPKFRVIERDYVNLYEHMISLGAGVEKNGVGAHGLRIPVADEYRDLQARQPRSFGSNGAFAKYPSLYEAREVADAILYLDPSSNGELAYRAFEAEGHKTGLASDRPGGWKPRCPLFVCRYRRPAPAGADDTDLVWAGQQGARLVALYAKCGTTGTLAHTDGSPALLPGSRSLPVLGGALTNL